MPSKPPKHTLVDAQPYHETNKAVADRRRGSAASRGYDARWRKIRASVLAEEPLCRMCKAKGFVTAASEVDHIDGDAWNRKRDNLRPLCKPCHSSRTARDQAFGRKEKQTVKASQRGMG